MSRAALIVLSLAPLVCTAEEDETYRHACVFSEREQAWLCVNRDADDDKTLYRRSEDGWIILREDTTTRVTGA